MMDNKNMKNREKEVIKDLDKVEPIDYGVVVSRSGKINPLWGRSF